MPRLQSSGFCEVLLSFGGKDSTSFSSHLYTSFLNAGIYIFSSDYEGNKFETMQTIRQSTISIVVLSRNYADSSESMDKLANIMSNPKTGGGVVVPVFYDVDPSEVRTQTGNFGKAFDHLVSKEPVDFYSRKNWETTLFKIGGIPGFVFKNSRNENEDIEKVVDHVINLLNDIDLLVVDHPVGTESRVNNVIQLLNNQQSKDPILLGIWGMGEIGKTTIAKAIYNKIHRNFEAKSIILNVREVWKQENDKVSLQQRLLSFISKITKIKIDTVESGKLVLQQRLRQKRILLVLDDVDNMDQLNALCGSSKWFGRGSRIIITTRNKQIFSQLEADHVYSMKEMDGNGSLVVLSWHAVKQLSPSEIFVNLSGDVVKYCEGLPLALNVLGSFMATRSKTQWKNAIKSLEIVPPDMVMNNLRISFDGLTDNVKEIFLEIASFLIGMDLDDVIQILNCSGHAAEIGITLLVEQSLVTVDSKNRIGMHNLVRVMGREIIRQKAMGMAKSWRTSWKFAEPGV